MWSKYRQIQGKATSNRINAIKYNGKVVTEDSEIADLLGDSFQAISSNDAYDLEFSKRKKEEESSPLDIQEQPETDYNQTYTFHELEEALEGLRGSSPGPDDVHYAMICNLPIDCKMQLLDSYNRLWMEGIFPTKWTKSTVIPIYKGKGERANPHNYRPIYLNSCMGKVFERMVNNRLTHILESRKLLYEHQYAFRKGKTTVDHLAEMEETIRGAMAKNHYAQVAFLDVTKAYDTTWRRLILKKLQEWGIGGEMLCFLENMLKVRTFKVLANGTFSSEKLMETGLCQGSVLSVSMFLIAIDTIVQYLPSNVKCLIYADDIVLIATGANLKDVEAQLQTAMNMVGKWESETGYKISPEKSSTVIFRNMFSRKPKNQNTLTLNGTLIPREVSHKCLGVIFYETLQFRKHAEEVRAGCQQRIQLIRSLAARNWGGDSSTLLKL